MISFDKSFKEGYITDIDALLSQALEDRKKIKFKEYKKGLYVSVPFGGFIGDCETCRYYDNVSNVTIGGHCMKHNMACGYGFTCPDNTSKYAIRINNNSDDN